MAKIPASQLVLTSDGAVYHLKLFPEQLADTVILVGDPNRVELVSSFFDDIEFRVSNREINTHTGYYRGKRISVISTGMGTDNIDIVLNELDALVNVDLKSREIKKEKTSLNLIRIGTSGALQNDIPVGESFVAGEMALGLDGLLYFYKDASQVIEKDFTDAFITQTHYPDFLPRPYAVKASAKLLKLLAPGCIKGVTATSPGFYGPQGRVLRLDVVDPMMNKKIEDFSFQTQRITNFEMESSALYGLSRLMGHEALTICLIIANRVTEEFAGDYHPYMKKLILQTLDRVAEEGR